MEALLASTLAQRGNKTPTPNIVVTRETVPLPSGEKPRSRATDDEKGLLADTPPITHHNCL